MLQTVSKTKLQFVVFRPARLPPRPRQVLLQNSFLQHAILYTDDDVPGHGRLILPPSCMAIAIEYSKSPGAYTSHHYMCRHGGYDDPAAASWYNIHFCDLAWHGEKRPRTAHDLFPSTVLVDNKSHLLVTRCNAANSAELTLPTPKRVPPAGNSACFKRRSVHQSSNANYEGTNKTSPQPPPFTTLVTSRDGTGYWFWASHRKGTLRDARYDLFSFRTGAHRVTVYCTQLQDYDAERAAYTSRLKASTEKRWNQVSKI